MGNKEIVIVTKYFGYNFTGATLSTHELVKRWSKYVKNIKVITRIIGEYDKLDNLEVITCKDNKEIIKRITQMNSDSIFYSDDHLAYLITKAKKNYYHTYHASWPQAKWINFKYFIKSFVFISLYKKAIKNSIEEIMVSSASKKFVESLNSKNKIIRNGLGKKSYKQRNKNQLVENNKILMIGNIDKNKYSLALELFKKISESNLVLEIDIYGRELDLKLKKELEKFEFVNYKGFNPNIKIEEYDLMINTSKNENLSIAVCEGIKSNVPVLCFDVGAMKEVIKNGDNGFIVEKENIEKMFKYTEEIILGKYKFEFKDRTIDEFDWDKSAKLYLMEFKKYL